MEAIKGISWVSFLVHLYKYMLLSFHTSPLLTWICVGGGVLFFVSEIIRVGDNKKVHQIELIPSEQLIAVISGRNRHVRLFPMAALDGRETEFYKLAETKGCQSIVSGHVRHGALTCLCVAMKRQVLCYELNQSKTRHKKIKEIQV